MPKCEDRGNLFIQIPDDFSVEKFNTIFEDNDLKIERIISNGHATAKNQWLEEDRDEWVLLLQGAAKLIFQERSNTADLKPGDYIFIKAHTKHRVEWTDTEQKTIWLAVYGKTKNS
jgi:cupin 2 domain-containing protein